MVAAEGAKGDIVPRVLIEAVLDDGRLDLDLGRETQCLQLGQRAIGDAQVSDAVWDVRLRCGPRFQRLIYRWERRVKDKSVDVD